MSTSSEVVVFTSLGQLHGSSIFELLSHSLDLILVNENFRGLEDGGFYEREGRVTNESSEEPDERLLKLIV